MNFNNIMLDLETLGQAPNGVIVSIGAVKMDLENLRLGQTFYAVVRIEDAQRLGMRLEAATVRWWLQQSKAARAVFSEESEPLYDVLKEFSSWALSNISVEDLQVWGNGATFDNVILHSAYKACGLRAPWNYRGDMCFRTMLRMFPVTEIISPPHPHNALRDAAAQAHMLLNILRKVRSGSVEAGAQ